MSLEDIFPNEASLATAMAKCETQKRQKNGWAKKWVGKKMGGRKMGGRKMDWKKIEPKKGKKLLR